MNKIVVVILLLAVVAIVAFAPSAPTKTDFLRIHVRANSNQKTDQEVKYAVKDAIVQYLTPLLEKATTKQLAMQVVQSNLRQIEKVCNAVLDSYQMDYHGNAKLTEETFPDRTYDGVTLASGVYDALIVNLGSGKGDNWWCVVYPPLCFVGGQSNGTSNVVLASKLAEIVRQWKLNH